LSGKKISLPLQPNFKQFYIMEKTKNVEPATPDSLPDLAAEYLAQYKTLPPNHGKWHVGDVAYTNDGAYMIAKINDDGTVDLRSIRADRGLVTLSKSEILKNPPGHCEIK
jgi:hypothetical protein